MNDQEIYKKYVLERLKGLTPVFAKASIGDFSQDVEIPEGDDEFTELYAGVGIMVGVIRKNMERLKDDKEELEILINNLPIGVFIAEAPSGRPLLANRRAQELLGNDLKEEVRASEYTRAYNVITEDGQPYPDDEHPISITIKTGKPAKKDDIVINKTNGVRTILKVQTAPVFNDGVMISVISVFDDITKERELENMKTEFVSLASHQLRSPLSIMRWNLELFMKSGATTTPKSKEQVDSIYKNVLKMITLVNDMLSVSKVDEGELEHKIEDVDVVSVINEILTEVKVVYENKMVNMIFNGSQPPLKVKADRKKLHDAILNLLDNSIKFNTPLGKTEIILTPKDGLLTIEISDTGIGIPRQDKAQVFNRFYRATNAVSLQSPGTGLGLYLVKKYVVAWGGTIQFESPANERFRESVGKFDNPGTSFYIALKMAGGEVI